MNANLIATTPKGNMNALACQGIMVTDCYPQIRDMLRRREGLGDDAVLLFAEPEPNAADNSVDWYTPVQGAVQRLTELPEEEQNVLRDKLSRMAEEIRRYADELRQSPDSSKQTRGEILRLALQYPGEEALFVVGGQPVFTCWGYGPGRPGAEPQDLARLTRLAAVTPQPPPPSAPVAEESTSPEVPAKEEPAPPPEKRSGCLLWLPGCLLWLLALLLLLLLLLLLFVGFGGFPAISGYTLFKVPWPAPVQEATALRQQNDALDQELAGLRRQALAHAQRCEPGPQPAVPDEPVVTDEKLVIPEKTDDMRFLQGRWLCRTGLVNDQNNEPVVVEFIFDGTGKGEVVLHERGNRCTGTAHADKGLGSSLHIEVSPQTCANGDSYSAQVIDCKNSGQAAQCSGTNKSTKGGSWKAQFFRIRD